MGAIEKAISWMENLARDDSHGYDQGNRWGPDFDCSSAVITAWEQAGVPLKSRGFATYTGNIYQACLQNGFKDVTSQINKKTGAGLQRGDILLNHVNHVAMYCGNGMKVEASGNENGGIIGGRPGDQTGREIRICAYSDYWAGWDCILRYQEKATGGNTTPTQKIEVNMGKNINKTKKWTGMVIADELNVRQWAGTEFGCCSFSPLVEGTRIDVCDSIYASDHSVWHYIKYNGKYGFVHGDYVERV